MRSLYAIAIFIAIFNSCRTVEPGIYRINDYGAKSGEGIINTTAIQSAIDACNENGGGRVIVPPGLFYTGSLILKSNVELHLMNGAVLKGSPDLSDYDREKTRGGLIFAINTTGVAITGSGTIDGNGTMYHDSTRMHIAGDLQREYIRQGEEYLKEGKYYEDGPIFKDQRPGMVVVIMKSERLRLSDFTVVNSPEWSFRIGDCDNVIIKGITILNNLLIPNSDGIHCTNSRNVNISGCDIRAGDDAIIVTGFSSEINVHGELEGEGSESLYGNKTGYSENITVSNCQLLSRSSGIRVGYGMNPIRNLTFSNIVIYNSNRGIGLFARDGAVIENILFSDIIIQTRLHGGHWWGKGEPVHISAITQHEGKEGGKIRNIRFSNIMAESESGMVLWGEKPGSLQDIQFEKVSLKIKPSPLAEEFGGNFDLRPVADMRYALFRHDIPGVYAGNVDGLVFKDFKLEWEKGLAPWHSSGLQAESVKDLYIDPLCRFPSAPDSGKPDKSINP